MLLIYDKIYFNAGHSYKMHIWIPNKGKLELLIKLCSVESSLMSELIYSLGLYVKKPIFIFFHLSIDLLCTFIITPNPRLAANIIGVLGPQSWKTNAKIMSIH